MTIPFGKDYPAAPWIDGAAAEPVKAFEPTPKLYRATDLAPAAQPTWLAKGRIPRSAITLLVGDEGIGKSLLWVWLVSFVTTGKPCVEFGIPHREPGRVVLVITEDDWATTVLPRLMVAGADIEMIDVICAEKDGSGIPVFPRDTHLLFDAAPAPALVVVDTWLDTVAPGLRVKDPQQARQALHPWKEVATSTGTAVWLVVHTNRVTSSDPRDRYAATMELRKKARATLYAQHDEEGNLIVGPEKMNTAAPLPASSFRIQAVQYFDSTEDDAGTVPSLVYAGQSDHTAREYLAMTIGEEPGGSPALVFLVDYLMDEGGEAKAADVIKDGRAAGFSEDELKSARSRSRNPRIATRKASFGTGWVWAIELAKDAEKAMVVT